MILYLVLGLARCATKSGTPEQAAALHGGADAQRSTVSGRWQSLEAEIREKDIAVLRERLGVEFEREGTNAIAAKLAG